MFGLSWMKRRLHYVLAMGLGALAGVAFMALASASIQFDEAIAPKFAWLTGAGASRIGPA